MNSVMQVEVRGHSTLSDRTHSLFGILSTLTDGLILDVLILLALRSFNWIWVPSVGALLLSLVAGWVLIVLNRNLGHRMGLIASPGDWLWGIEREGRLSFQDFIPFRASSKLSSRASKPLNASMAVALLLALLGFLFHQVYLATPLFQVTEKKLLPPFAPESNRFHVLPFFYTSGAWPKNYRGQPILYQLPYEKGPPKHFAGKVIARWFPPEVIVTLRGPKTQTKLDVSKLEDCFTQSLARLPNWKCLKERKNILEKPIRQVSIDAKQWQLDWFEVDNREIPPEDWPRGLRLIAKNDRETETHYILFNRKGTQQSIEIRRPNSQIGEDAHRLLEKTVRSLRVFEHLLPGRAVVNQRLAETRLNETQAEESIKIIGNLSQVQALLVAKISVEPKSHDAYYHLGGTALMIAKHAAEVKTRSTQVLNAETAAMVDDWSSAAKPVVHSAYLYAQDVKKDHPNTTRLQQLWIEAQNY